ncbi:hypothetical protein [Flavobacterium eburneipallidum]|uniref:hypothetical protein n=1 Tax=Flavobacterium eburneipallidum TaxID=3003263 RepID=UPI0022ABF826|nr:hypothetical protein [Flavobacterium eburneipallidum]
MKVNISKLYFIPIMVFAILISCKNSSNEKIEIDLETEFSDSISKDKAEYFNYLYDGLVPQESYFVKSKLKYLKFRHEPESGFVERKVYFDLKTGSIKKFVLRLVIPDVNSFSNGVYEKHFDTIFVVFPKQKLMITYSDNKIIDSTFRKSIFDENEEFIYKIKLITEQNYNQEKTNRID